MHARSSRAKAAPAAVTGAGKGEAGCDVGHQTVLVLQGGGALGAYQMGVYQALQEAGIEPDWVIGTSIGAINAALIAATPPPARVGRMQRFWGEVGRMASRPPLVTPLGMERAIGTLQAFAWGIPGFFRPGLAAWLGPLAGVGGAAAGWYDTAPLRHTLDALIDFPLAGQGGPRLTVGAVDVESGQLRYFDSREQPIRVEHVLASGALPPAFPPVQVDGRWYWDGGIYSNTPIEAVLDDTPRRSALVFAVQLWNAAGPLPRSVTEAMHRQKDIQYASRASSHLQRQRQLHGLRHVIGELAREIPAARRGDPRVRRLLAAGCTTTMHVVRLVAPRLSGEDQFKDLDFTPEGIEARRAAGQRDARRVIGAAPWTRTADPTEGVIEHAVEASI